MTSSLKPTLPVCALALAGLALSACAGHSPGPAEEDAADRTAHRISLPVLSEAERARIQRDSKPDREPMQTGLGRDFASDEALVPLAELAWQPEGEDDVARVAVTSRGALGLRLGLDLVGDSCPLSFRFSGSDGSSNESFSAATVAGAESVWWSPVTNGETAIMHLSRPSGADLSACELRIPQLSHLF